MPPNRPLPLLLLLLLLPLQGMAQDKECTAKLGRMQSCFTFIEGKSSTPSNRCCKGLQYVYTHSPVCLCELLTSTGGVAATPGINISNAVVLPVHCKVDTNTSACPALLANHSSGHFYGPSSLLVVLVSGLSFLIPVLLARWL